MSASLAPPSRRIAVRYPAASELASGAEGSRLKLALDSSRGTVGVRGRVKDPLLFRDAFATTLALLAADLRYRHRDRAAYLAFLAKQGKRASAKIWEAQKEFLEEELSGDTRAARVLDPVFTVHPDEVSLEVFSKDESAWARLALSRDLFDRREAAHGTTTLDLSPKLAEQVDRLRTWQPLQLEAGTAFPGSAPATRDVEVPYAWLRGFLQVQSAATLPALTGELAPVDLYNLLYAIRTRRAKKPPRALRFELVPGAAPRLVIEPWEVVIECHGAPFSGPAPRVIRTFGRQRLLGLSRVLPHVKKARFQLLGPGLPVFWVLDLGLASLTLGLTGWAESGWSSATAFDALMPSPDAAPLAERIARRLDEKGPLSFEILTRDSGAEPEACRAALQLLCLKGRVLYDLARQSYRPRPLLAEPVDDAAIRYRDEREARAHRLLGPDGAGEVTLEKLHEIQGEGTEVSGEVTDREAHRSFAVRFLLDGEGRVTDGSCLCPAFRRAGLREGPCEHLLALRLAHARKRAELERLRASPEGRSVIRAETRTLVRRDAEGRERLYRVSLDETRVVVRWGARNEELREQRLWYDSDREAREAYFARLDSLVFEGYVDADAG